VNWEFLDRREFVAHLKILDLRSSIPRDRSYDYILAPRPEPLYEPTQSHTRPIWNEVSVHKAEVSVVDKASLKTLPTSYEYAVYIILLCKLDRS
jgi:hypothetical protein